MQLPESEWPRERLMRYGPKLLSNQELLAILLRTGTKQKSVMELSLHVLEHFSYLYDFKTVTFQELMEIDGIGMAKATEILAMIELGRRINHASQKKGIQVVNDKLIGEHLINEIGGYEQEHLRLVCLNQQNEIIHERDVFIGSVNESVAQPREILRCALKMGAVKFILAHNHPSGVVQPSQNDIDFTKRMQACSKLIGLEFLDHIIVSSMAYISLKSLDYLT